SFCSVGLATAGDEVACVGRRHWLPCDGDRASRGGSPTCTTVWSARRLAPEGYLSHVRNGGLGGLAWSRLSLRCTIGRDSLGLRVMNLGGVLMSLAAVLFFVGVAGWVL